MLKQLKLRKELALKQAELEKLRASQQEFEKRTSELTTALEESKTEEDMKLVSENIEVLEKEIQDADIDNKSTKVEGEIAEIEKELSELDERSKQTKQDNKTKQPEERGETSMNKLQVREMLKNGTYYERAEVKEFYDKFKSLRAVTGEGLTIPEIVVNRILDILGDYSTLYPLVDKIRANGTVRILIDTDTTAATWIEAKAAIPTGDVGTITDISFDGFKIGKVTFVDNCMLQDSIINLDEYVTRKIARAIALGLDLAILKGTGALNKQPDGIIPQLPVGNVVAVTTGKLADILAKLALVDTGSDAVGEIVAVMHRKTYYARFLQYSINVDAKGNVVGKLPNLNAPDLCGLRVVFNNNMDQDKVLFGDFNKYTLVERETVTIDKSEHVKFTEDQMGFRGKGRFDGKPTKKDAFVLVTVTPAA
jgi:HK97 family phage major capsid protein